MPWCVVIGCKNNMKATKRAGKDVSYHMFPKNPQRRTAWINSLNRPFKLNADSSYICSEHFISDDFECYSLKEKLLNIKVKRQLKKTAVPSINIPKSLLEEQLNVSVDLTYSQTPNKITTTCYEPKNNQPEVHHHCVVPLCNNTSSLSNASKSNNKIVFYKFPSDFKIFDKWIEFCNGSKNKSLEYKNAVICSEHFSNDSYEVKCIPESIHATKVTKVLKIDAVPTLNGEIRIINEKIIERKNLVEKLLADYEQQQKNESQLKGIGTKYPSCFSPKINPNAKLGDKLKLLKAIDNQETFSPPKKRKTSELIKSNTENLKLSNCTNSSQNKDQVIQVSAVKGGLMLHALPQKSNVSKNVINEEEESEEIIIVTEDEASRTDLSLYEEQHKEINTEVIIVTNFKETEDTLKHVEYLPKKCPTNNCDNVKFCIQNQLGNNESQSSSLYTAKVSLNEDKGCQVLIPCKGCEHKCLKINKLLRERTRLLQDLNQNGTWKDPDEINTLRKMNGVLSMLLMHCVGEKNGKKSSSIRVDLVQDSIEKVNSGWSMQDTSEVLCQALSVNAYDEFARTFEIIHQI